MCIYRAGTKRVPTCRAFVEPICPPYRHRLLVFTPIWHSKSKSALISGVLPVCFPNKPTSLSCLYDFLNVFFCKFQTCKEQRVFPKLTINQCFSTYCTETITINKLRLLGLWVKTVHICKVQISKESWHKESNFPNHKNNVLQPFNLIQFSKSLSFLQKL